MATVAPGTEFHLLKVAHYGKCSFALVSCKGALGRKSPQLSAFVRHSLTGFFEKPVQHNQWQLCNEKLKHHLVSHFCPDRGTIEFAFIVNRSKDAEECKVYVAVEIMHTIERCLEEYSVQSRTVKQIMFFVSNKCSNIVKSFLDAFHVSFDKEVFTIVDNKSPFPDVVIPESNTLSEPESGVPLTEPAEGNDETVENRGQTLLVRNIPKSMFSIRDFEHYFYDESQSQKRKIKKVEHDEFYGGVLVRLRDQETFDRAVAKTDHVLQNQPLIVTKLYLADETKFYLKYVPAWVTECQLKIFLEIELDVVVKNIIFNRKERIAFIEMSCEKDISTIHNALSQTSLKGDGTELYFPVMHKVHITDAVVMFGQVPDPDLAKPFIENYLKENSADVDATVLYIIPGKDELTPRTQVIFKDYRAVQLFKCRFRMNNIDYFVEPFYPCVTIV